MRMESQEDNCLFFVIDYRPKGWIPARIAGCFVTGRIVQKIALLTFQCHPMLLNKSSITINVHFKCAPERMPSPTGP